MREQCLSIFNEIKNTKSELSSYIMTNNKNCLTLNPLLFLLLIWGTDFKGLIKTFYEKKAFLPIFVRQGLTQKAKLVFKNFIFKHLNLIWIIYTNLAEIQCQWKISIRAYFWFTKCYSLGNITYGNNDPWLVYFIWTVRTTNTWWGHHALASWAQWLLNVSTPLTGTLEGISTLLQQVLTPMRYEATKPGWFPHSPDANPLSLHLGWYC